MKKIVIIGAGEIGTFLAERLTAEQIDVTVIDRDAEVLSNLQNTMDVAGVLGDATSLGDLQDAGIEDADLLIATTRQDETNLIACLLAKDLKIPHTIAVTRYLGLRGQREALRGESLGIDLLVNSSEAVKNEIMEIVETTGASEVARFAGGRIILVGVQVDAESGLSSKSVGLLCGNGGVPRFNIASIVRKNELLEFDENTLLEMGDYLYVLSTQDHLPELNEALNMETIKTRNAVIFGDNFLSQLMAGALLTRHFHVTMLASTGEKATFLRNHFQGRHQFQVETGSGIDVRLLRRMKVPSTSVFIAAHTDDAKNFTACLLAKSLGAVKTIATIKRTDILALCRKGGVDVNIAPRLATAKAIQRIVHDNRLLNYRAVTQTNLEVVELEAQERSKITKSKIGKLKLPKGVVIGAIASGDSTTLPMPEERIKAGDKVIVLTLPERILEVEALFGERP